MLLLKIKHEQQLPSRRLQPASPPLPLPRRHSCSPGYTVPWKNIAECPSYFGKPGVIAVDDTAVAKLSSLVTISFRGNMNRVFTYSIPLPLTHNTVSFHIFAGGRRGAGGGGGTELGSARVQSFPTVPIDVTVARSLDRCTNITHLSYQYSTGFHLCLSEHSTFLTPHANRPGEI